MVWPKDTESRFLTVNSRFAEAFGQPSTASLIGKTDRDIAAGAPQRLRCVRAIASRHVPPFH